jgi:hypothetical protein
MAHMVYYVISLFISWKEWCCIILLNLSDYCKEDDFERTYIKVSKSTLCFVTCFSINKLAFPLTPLLCYLLGFSSFFYLTTFSDMLAIHRVKVLEHYTRLGDSLCLVDQLSRNLYILQRQ